MDTQGISVIEITGAFFYVVQAIYNYSDCTKEMTCMSKGPIRNHLSESTGSNNEVHAHSTAEYRVYHVLLQKLRKGGGMLIGVGSLQGMSIYTRQWGNPC